MMQNLLRQSIHYELAYKNYLLTTSPPATTIVDVVVYVNVMQFSVPQIEYPLGGSSNKGSHVYFLLPNLLCNIIILSNCTTVGYKCSDPTMVTWCHNSTIWRHNSSAMATINRKASCSRKCFSQRRFWQVLDKYETWSRSVTYVVRVFLSMPNPVSLIHLITLTLNWNMVNALIKGLKSMYMLFANADAPLSSGHLCISHVVCQCRCITE